ncbi:MAG: L,D-transpeptidase [Verrucomicrobiota bacterium]
MAALAPLILASCASKPSTYLVASVEDQKMALVDDERLIAIYPISTSKFGLGNEFNSFQTPLGKLQVAKKYGGGAVAGAVFKDRRPTGEVLPIDAPGRDPIVTRILWLRGLEEWNKNSYPRYIYIHGTPEERNLGKPYSWGCIRMRSSDIIGLYDRVPVGTVVEIVKGPLRPEIKPYLEAIEKTRQAEREKAEATPEGEPEAASPSAAIES